MYDSPQDVKSKAFRTRSYLVIGAPAKIFTLQISCYGKRGGLLYRKGSGISGACYEGSRRGEEGTGEEVHRATHDEVY